MSVENIVERIISDAKNEASSIIAEAERRAEETVSKVRIEAGRKLAGTRAETEQKVKSVLDGKSATARLDCAKIELAEKLRVLDTVYAQALEKLVSLDKKESVAIAERLITEYAEEGDEIVFATNYKFAPEVMKLDIVKEKKLTHSVDAGGISGGFVFKGKIADKDVSYAALLAADREENVSEIAVKLFNQG